MSSNTRKKKKGEKGAKDSNASQMHTRKIHIYA